MNGQEHITATFEKLRQKGRAALMPYFTLGYPTPALSLEIVQALANSGADLIELGVPFSDPLADGPTIQRSTQQALEQGMNVQRCLEQVAQLRARGVTQPLLLMGYINPVLAYGLERFITASCAAGVDGLIIPDLPMEEADEVEALCRKQGLALVYLASPSSPPERIRALAQRTTGFLYLVSLTGVTGARSQLPPGLEDFVGRVRAAATTPLAVGFGISSPEQARAVGELADGVIIGSAVINAVSGATDPVKAAANYVTTIRAALVGTAEKSVA